MKIRLTLLIMLFLLIFPQAAFADTLTVRYQAEVNYPPFKFEQNNYLSGFDIELTNLIFNNKEYMVDYSIDTWDKVYENLVRGDIDTCGMMAVTEQRKKDILFSKVVYKSYIGVYSRKGFREFTLQDLKNLRIGVGSKQFSEEILNNELGITDYQTFTAIGDAVDALNKGQLDVLFENQQVVDYYLIKYDLRGLIEPRLTNLYPSDIAYGVRLSYPKLVDFMNKRIIELEKAGIYEELYQKYFFSHSQYYYDELRSRISAVTGIVLLGLLLVALSINFYIRHLKKKITFEQSYSNSVVNYAKIIIIVWEMDGTIVKFNRYGEQITGFKAEELIGKKYIHFMVPYEIRSYVADEFGKVLSGEIVENLENPILCKDGTRIDFLWNNSMIYNENGNPAYGISMGVDITERKRTELKLAQSYQELEATHEELIAAEEELKQQFEELQLKEKELVLSDERYRLAIDGANDILWDIDFSKKTIFVSDRGKELAGYNSCELGDSIEEYLSLIYPEDVEEFRQSFDEYINSPKENAYYKTEVRFVLKSGDINWVLLRGQAIWDSEGKPVRMAGSLTDINERKTSEEKINYMAFYDSLTGLPNRTLFTDRLTQALANARRKGTMVSLFFLDLDNFKTINDTLGHLFGDELLKHVGALLKKCIRMGDTVARLGGDEFVIMQPEVRNLQEVVKVAERMINAFKKPWSLEGREFYITSSIGITIYPQDGEDTQTLFKNADTAMYKAKEVGKNNYQLFTSSMNTLIIEKLEWENRLRHALDRGEFRIYYQPQIDITSGELTGMEALLRWEHPVLGLLPPARFIPLAEESGLIIPISEWVLENACRQNKQWQDAGYKKISVSVNLSPKQFQKCNLIEVIREVINKTGLEPQWLDLEITEGIAMLDLEYTVPILKELRDMGVRISLDDFGTGYSSLNYLKTLPISTLKIDKTFVKDVNKGSADAGIAKAVITLARNMNLTVYAEGVETHEQLDFLKNEKCDRAQGYLFSKPVPPENLEELLKNGSFFYIS